MKTNKINETEKATLKTFQKEIPSNYFYNKGINEYSKITKNAEYMYKYHLKLPPEMFKDKKLIDFGAGTGENTIYLANWGAKCTLVEMNPVAHEISKKVFKKHSKSIKDHKFINSSIFDASIKKNFYDIVHCRGVLSHTSGNCI
jgi:2-polyprenyl-3-methyl-5-hydroxy-6-metoxy-1,4-benzoquinol methylase